MPLPLTHAASTLVLYRFLLHCFPSFSSSYTNTTTEADFNMMVILEICLLISSITPDGVDKPLYWGRISCCTRTYGHTLLFAFLFSAITAAVSHSGKNASFTFFIISFSSYYDLGQIGRVCLLGIISHLLADRVFGYVPFFWPFQPFVYPSMIHTKRRESGQGREARSVRWLPLSIRFSLSS